MGKDDIFPQKTITIYLPDLARFLVHKIAKQQGRELTITDSTIRVLMQHRWPGNVRELENCLERGAIQSESGVIDRDVIDITGCDHHGLSYLPTPDFSVESEEGELGERERVIAALEQAGWVQAKAAGLLSMTPRQIAYRIQVLNIKMRRI